MKTGRPESHRCPFHNEALNDRQKRRNGHLLNAETQLQRSKRRLCAAGTFVVILVLPQTLIMLGLVKSIPDVHSDCSTGFCALIR